MVALIRQFGQWLKQGFGWLVDVFVTVCTWGISQVERLLGTHLTINPDVGGIVALLIFIVLILVVAWLLRNVWYRVRIALSMVADAIGTLVLALAGIAGFFGGIGMICFIVLWATGHTNIASLR